ncbi:MAG: hypothetical protein AB1568_05735 [Thermodesulfobacteriota bacterium]
MLRIATLMALLFSLLVIGRETLRSWQAVELPREPVVERKKSAGLGPMPVTRFYPEVPAVIPDLAENYLFNEQRKLGTDEPVEEGGEEPIEEPAETVDMENLEYVGSIILGDLRKAMVSFTVSEPAPPQPEQPGRPPVRGMPQLPPQTARRAGGEQKVTTVSEKEEFYGYLVASILPDRITFSRGSDSVEKLLYDPEKERKEPAAGRRPPPGANRPAAVPAAVPGNVPQPPPVQVNPAVGQPPVVAPAASAAPVPPVHRRVAIPPRAIPRPDLIQRRQVPGQQPGQ